MNVLQEWKVGYQYNIYVTYVTDPKSFFIHLAAHRELLEIIERPGPDSLSADTIQLGQRVVYKSETLRKFVRGQIQYIETNEGEMKFDIFAIDYGCCDKSVSARCIRPPDKNEPQSGCPGLATHCELYLCEPKEEGGFSKEVIDTMKKLVDEKYGAINVMHITSDRMVVQLMNAFVPRDVADFLAKVGLTVMLKNVPQSLPCPANQLAKSLFALNFTKTLEYKHKKLNVGDKLNVTVRSGTSESGFYVAEVNDLQELRYASGSFSEYVKNRHMKVEDFVPGRPCAVKPQHSETYERAKIKKVNPNSTAVLELVDWGKEIESNFSSIRSIDNDSFLTQPIVAIYVATSVGKIIKPSLPYHIISRLQYKLEILELGNNSDKPHNVTMY